jgi:hypothetical protein
MFFKIIEKGIVSIKEGTQFVMIYLRTLHEIVWKEVREYLNENEIENAILNSVNFINGE